MMVELNFLSAVAPKSGEPAATTEDEGGNEANFNSLFEDSLMTEQAPPPADEDGAPPFTETERPSAVDDFSVPPLMVAMVEITNSLGLTEQQVSRLADLLGVSVDETGRIEITPKNQGKDFSVLMPDGTSSKLAELLNLAEDGQLVNKREAVTRIADMLGLTKTTATALLEKLGIFSFEIFDETIPPPPKVVTTQTAQKGENAPIAQVKAENNIQPSGQNSGQNANNNNDASGETVAASIGETDGDSTKNSDSGFKAALNHTAQTTAVVEGSSFREPVASASRTFQPFTPPGGMEETNVGDQAKAVMNRIVEKASIISFPNRTRVRISLSPPSLGFVNIEISTRNEGASALIVVESHAVKQVIEQNIHQLKATFEQQGIKVEQMNVSVAEQGGNSFENDARFKDAQSALSDYTAIGETMEENPEDDTLKNERARKKTHNYVLDITV